METETGSSQASAALPRTENKTIFAILVAASFSHLLNDTIQSLIPAIYPVLKDTFDLNFAQIGLITLTFQITASMLQPVVGLYTDHRPQPFSLAIGMGFSLIGLICAFRGQQLLDDSRSGCLGRTRLIRISSRSVAPCPNGLRRSLRFRSVLVSSWG